MIEFDRRGFLFASAGIVFSRKIQLPIWQSFLCVEAHDWLSIPFESTSFEILGATKGGALLPNFDQALIREASRVVGLQISVDGLHNIDLVNGCGLFTVYTCCCGEWKKFRLWNYLECAPPDYPVTVCVDPSLAERMMK